jgi:hypothetical protein
MLTLETIHVWATSIFAFVVLAFITANIRTFASKRGMDTYLDRWADHPHVVAFVKYCQKALASLSPLERRWWLWLALEQIPLIPSCIRRGRRSLRSDRV